MFNEKLKREMNNNEINRIAELIWSNLNTIENQNKTKAQQIKLIKPTIIVVMAESRKQGRNQILNHIGIEIDNLRDN